MIARVVVAQDLIKEYPKIRAVESFSITVPSGEIFGLLGPNGAGKTTTIRILLTLIKPSEGRASLFGIDISKHPEKAREIAGYVPQDVSVDWELTGYENILMYAKLYGLSGKERILAFVREQQNCDSPKTSKIARDFIRKWER